MRLTPLLVGLLLLVPAGTAASWSQENADPANTGRMDRAAPNGLDGAVFRTLDGRPITQVVEGPAGLALTGTLDGTVVALDAEREVRWQADVEGEIRAAPTWTGEIAVVVPRSDTAHAFTPTGDVAWTLDIENERPSASVVRMASPVTHPSGDAIVSTLAGNVHRVAPNGTVQWTYDFGEDLAVEATPAITPDGDVIAAAFTPGEEGRGFLARIDGATGMTDCSDCWREEIGSQVVGAPAVTADVVLVPLRDGNALEARALADGRQRWETGFDDSIPASPTLHGDLAIVGDIRGTVRGVEVTGGQIAWSFNPLEDDPNTGELATSQCSALTVADSVAVDQDGIAWTPYWKADICSGFPPQDSKESPFYRLDAETGDVLDRDRYPKANHGPALHETGVWAGNDEGGVRVYPTGPSLQVHAQARGGEAVLVTNTDRSGPWEIRWDGQTTASGDGQPPPTSTRTLDPGTHRVTVTVGDATAQDTVEIRGEDEPAPPAANASDDEDQAPSDPGGSGSTDDEASEPNTTNDTDDEQATPMGALTLLVALLAAAWGRRRA